MFAHITGAHIRADSVNLCDASGVNLSNNTRLVNCVKNRCRIELKAHPPAPCWSSSTVDCTDKLRQKKKKNSRNGGVDGR